MRRIEVDASQWPLTGRLAVCAKTWLPLYGDYRTRHQGAGMKCIAGTLSCIRVRDWFGKTTRYLYQSRIVGKGRITAGKSKINLRAR